MADTTEQSTKPSLQSIPVETRLQIYDDTCTDNSDQKQNPYHDMTTTERRTAILASIANWRGIAHGRGTRYVTDEVYVTYDKAQYSSLATLSQTCKQFHLEIADLLYKTAPSPSPCQTTTIRP